MMMTATFALQFLGLFFVIMGCAGIAQTRGFLKATEEISHSRTSVFLISSLRVMIGLVFALQTSLWHDVYGQIVVSLGVIIVLSGLFGLLFPDRIMEVIPAWIRSPKRIRAWFFVALVSGVALSLLGFGLV